MSLAPRGHDEAAALCRALAASAQWVPPCIEGWPVLVAHEYQRLHDELSAAAVVPAILQLKDVAEVVIKLVAVVAGRLLIDAGSPRQRGLARDLLLAERPPALGTWLAEGGRLCAEALRRDAPALAQAAHPFVAVLALLREPLTREATPLAQCLREIVEWRNRELGHGALRLDLAGYLPDLGRLLGALNQALAMHAAGVAAMTLVAQGAEDLALTGADALDKHQAALQALAAQQAYVPLVLRSGQAALSLAPYVYLHRSEDTDLGCYVVDKRLGRQRAARLHLLDYRTNAHAVARRADAEPMLLAELDALAEDDADPSTPVVPAGHAFDIEVQRFLDSISVQREYVSPRHFREALRQFTGPPDAPARSRGVFWLSAPADVGKTMFAFSLATLGGGNHLRESLGAAPLWEDMACLVFAARREYRSTSVSLEGHVFAELACAHNEVSLALSHYLRAPDPAQSPGAAVGAWLSAVRLQAAGRRGRLLLVLDALDELPTGEHRPLEHDLLRLIPTADELPPGVFLLLTSRGDPALAAPADANPADVQAVLADVQRRSDPALFQALALDPQAAQGHYHAVLRDYFDRRTRELLPDDAARDVVFRQVLDQGDHRFRQLAYYSAVIASGALRPDQLASLGRPLLEEHLAALRVHEGKRFALMQRILLELAAAEDAHLAELRWQEPAPVVPRAWLGLDLLELARRCDMPSERVGDLSPRFLVALQGCAELLRSFRGEASDRSRFALGLKGMVEQLQAIDGWSTVPVQRSRLLEGLDDFFAAQDEAAELGALWRMAGPALALVAQQRPFSLSRETAQAVTRRANDIFRRQPVESPVLIRGATAVLGLWLLTAFDEEAGVRWEGDLACASIALLRAGTRRARHELQAAKADAETAVQLYAQVPQGALPGQDDVLRRDRLASGQLLVTVLFEMSHVEACIERADEALAWLGQPLPSEAAPHLDLLYFRAAAQRHAGLYDDAVEGLDRLLQAIDAHLPQAPDDELPAVLRRQAEGLKEQGVALRRLGRPGQALQVLDAAIAAYERLMARNLGDERAELTVLHAGVHSDRANVHTESGHHDAAQADLEQALAMLDQVGSAGSQTDRHIQQSALVRMNLGALHLKLDRLAPAHDCFEQSVQLRLALRERMRERWTPGHQAGLALALWNRARAAPSANEQVAQHATALQAFQAIDDALGEQMPAPVRNDWALCHQTCAATLSGLERHDAAVAHFSAALDIIETTLRRSADPAPKALRARLSDALTARARALVMAGHVEAALADMDRLVELAQAVGGDPLQLVRMWMQRSELQVIRDDGEAAVRDLDLAVQALLQGLQVSGPADSAHDAARELLQRAWIRRGDAHWAASRPDAAVADYDRVIDALSTRPATAPEDAALLARSLAGVHLSRGHCHREAARLNQAHDDYLQAVSCWERLQDQTPSLWTPDDEERMNASYGLLLALYEGLRQADEVVWTEGLAGLRQAGLQRRSASTWRLLLPLLEAPAQSPDADPPRAEAAPAAWALPPLVHGPWREPEGAVARLCHRLVSDVLAHDVTPDAPWPLRGLRLRLLRLDCFMRCWWLEAQLPADGVHPPRLVTLWLTLRGVALLDGELQTLVTMCGAGGLRQRNPAQALQYLEVAFAARRTVLPRPQVVLGPDDLPVTAREAWAALPDDAPPRNSPPMSQDDGGWLVPIWLHDGSALVSASFRVSGDGLKIKQTGDAVAHAEFMSPAWECWASPCRWRESVKDAPLATDVNA